MVFFLEVVIVLANTRGRAVGHFCDAAGVCRFLADPTGCGRLACDSGTEKANGTFSSPGIPRIRLLSLREPILDLKGFHLPFRS